MALVFGLDIGTTSIGFAVIDDNSGAIKRLGGRVFPEARDPDGTPLNQQRRQKRMARRQLRRRRLRRKLLNQTLTEAGLLPPFSSEKCSDWAQVMKNNPYNLRKRGLKEALSTHEFGRAIYHLAQRRHFKGRDLDAADTSEDNDDKKAKAYREATLKSLQDSNTTLGAWLSERGSDERIRGKHATRTVVENEFEKLWTEQAKYLPALSDPALRTSVQVSIFAQRPVFWRKNTLGECRFKPGASLCPKGAWLSQQRRMLEKINNLALAGGNARPLDKDERRAILSRLQTQSSMTWGGVRKALAPVYKARGEPGAQKRLKFNLEEGGDKHLIGNAVEAKLAKIFGGDWLAHPRKQAIRNAVHDWLWSADYGEVGTQRVVILGAAERKANRTKAAQRFIDVFDATREQAKALAELKFPTGWEPYSTEALRTFLPELERGVRFGALVNGPDWHDWRNESFPNRKQPTGEVLDRLPSPMNREERRRIAELRNPTVVRTQNELRKVVNNLIDMFGKPDLIRVELLRDVGKSKREREEIQIGIRRQERRRRQARKRLIEEGITEPSHGDIEKWLLWEESGKRCPYTGNCISFDALFRNDEYQVEHIWPRSISLDNSFRNKTLCHREENIRKGNRIPYEYLHQDVDRWSVVKKRLGIMQAKKNKPGMSPGKVRRFLAQSIPDDFASRQLVDTSYSARQTMAQLKRLWPDIGADAPVNVQAVSGRVTAQLRKLWGLNNILAENGEKTREDHRHHAIDALVVACAHPGITQKLSRYWQAKEENGLEKPFLLPPWETIRPDAALAVADIVVSHRVRKKISGPLHKETVYGDTGEDVGEKPVYRRFVARKKLEALSKRELEDIRDVKVRKIVQAWVEERGGDPGQAFPPYPRLGENGPEIRKVRLLKKQQLSLMARVGTGYADLGENHHIAIYRMGDGQADSTVVSLLEATRRLARQEPVVQRDRGDGASFVMSLAAGEAIEIPNGEFNGIWIVNGVWANSQIVLTRHEDAVGATKWQPRAASLLRHGARKISIDPIGRKRPAND